MESLPFWYVCSLLARTNRAFTLRCAPVSNISKCQFSGEIHSDWREVIAKGISDKKLPVTLSSPNTVHEDSDDGGASILVSAII
jgi:hypothetical protein